MTDTETLLPQAQPNNGHGDGFMAWFDYLIKRKEMPEATASALRTGSRRVLEVEDDLPTLDVMTLDADDLVRRFRNAAKGAISQSSVDEYDRRFRMSLDSYRKWVNDDPEWLPKTRKTNSNGAPAKKSTPKTTAPTRQPRDAGHETHVEEPTASQGTITYPFPIRPGVVARLTLPDDLTEKEAKRVQAFIGTLAFAEPLAITAGPINVEE